MALLGLLLVIGTWVHYLALIPREKVPVRPAVHALLIVIGILLSFLGIFRPLYTGLAFPWPSLVLHLLTLVLGGFFLYLLTIYRLPDVNLTVRAGDPLPYFRAFDDTGRSVETTSWQGRRVLLKFFRGHW